MRYRWVAASYSSPYFEITPHQQREIGRMVAGSLETGKRVTEKSGVERTAIRRYGKTVEFQQRLFEERTKLINNRLNDFRAKVREEYKRDGS